MNVTAPVNVYVFVNRTQAPGVAVILLIVHGAATANPKSNVWLFAPDTGICVVKTLASAFTPTTLPSLSLTSACVPGVPPPAFAVVKLFNPRAACLLPPDTLGILTVYVVFCVNPVIPYIALVVFVPVALLK